MMATNTPPPRSAPITASSHDTAPVPRLASTPATIPGSVIAFGMIWSWRSMAVIAMSAARRAAATTKRAVGPNTVYADRNAAPVTASTSGYRQEIGIAQARQRPRRSAKESSGRLSYHAIGAPQPGHAEPGRQRLRRSGRRTITTFRKLPMARPRRQTAASAAAGAASASARSITSPRREQRGPDLPPHRGADHPEDPVRGVRGVELAGFEEDPDQPEPRLGGVELQLERVTKLLQRRLAVAEFGERVAEIAVTGDAVGLGVDGEPPERLRVAPDLDLVERENREADEPRRARHAEGARDDRSKPPGRGRARRDARQPPEHHGEPERWKVAVAVVRQLKPRVDDADDRAERDRIVHPDRQPRRPPPAQRDQRDSDHRHRERRTEKAPARRRPRMRPEASTAEVRSRRAS